MGRLVAVVALVTSACVVKIDYGSGPYLCESDGECPNDEPCIGGVCGGSIDAGPDADPTPQPAPRVADHLIGNRLSLDFNDANQFLVFRDRSRLRQDGFRTGTPAAPTGVFGTALDPVAANPGIPYSDRLAIGDDGLTIELWVESSAANPVLFGDPDTIITAGDVWLPTTTSMALYVGAPGGVESLIFAVMDNCGGTVQSARVPYSLSGQTHVAITWDRSEVIFYRDGAPVGTQALVADGCDFQRRFRVGETIDGTSQVVGYVDELKLSAGVKTAAQIMESMSFDSVANPTDCGNLVLDPSEDCDSDSMCCDTQTCRFAASGTACGSGTCTDGVCQTTAGRSTDDVLVLYEFDQITATQTLEDTSGVAPALDLAVPVGSEVAVDSGSLVISGPSVDLASAPDTTKISTAVAASGEFSVEAWVQPTNTTQGGPARIITNSNDTSLRNFLLGQQRDGYTARVRSDISTLNGLPEVHSAPGTVSTDTPTHLVLTRSADGTRRLWQDGVLVDMSTVSGDLAWDATYPIRIANEGGGNRQFIGRMFLVAVYSRAFGEERVAAHFLAGPQ